MKTLSSLNKERRRLLYFCGWLFIAGMLAMLTQHKPEPFLLTVTGYFAGMAYLIFATVRYLFALSAYESVNAADGECSGADKIE